MQSLEQTNYEAQFNRPTLRQQSQQAGYSYTDYGRVVGMAYSAQAAWDRNITMTASNWVKTKALSDDSPRVTQEQFDSSYGNV